MLLYYVYALSNPINDEIFYIGKGVSGRGLSHLKKPSNDEKGSVIKNIINAGKKPKVLVLAKGFKTENEALAIESLLILQANYSGNVFGMKARLTNIVAGHHAENYRAFGNNIESDEWEVESNLNKSKSSRENFYKEIIEKAPLFNNPQKSEGGYIRSEKMLNGFEFVVFPKGDHRVDLEYIIRKPTADHQNHSEKIYSILNAGKFKKQLGLKKEHARVDIETNLNIFQHVDIINVLTEFMSEIDKAEKILKNQ